LILRRRPTLSFRTGSKAPLSINPEQIPGFRPGEVEGLIPDFKFTPLLPKHHRSKSANAFQILAISLSLHHLSNYGVRLNRCGWIGSLPLP